MGQVRNDRFGPTIYNKAEVEERIRRAQRAILNPSTEARHFLQGDDEDPEERQLTFSNNCVSLQISGRDVGMLAIILSPCEIALIVSKSGFIICRYGGHRLTTLAEYHSLREFCRSPRAYCQRRQRRQC